MIRSSLRLYQVSRRLTPLIERNVPVVGMLETRKNLIWRGKATMAAVKVEEKPGLFKKVIKKIFDSSKTKYVAIGVLLYDKCANEPKFVDFVKELDFPDTFNSWFLITELHVWMLMTKCTCLENDGRHIRNSMVKVLWDDSLSRMKKLQPSGTNKVMQELSEQFKATLFAYDEGALSSDIVLANALWRRMFSSAEDVKPENLEILVSYVRRQIAELHKISDEDFCKKPTFNWVPLKV